jgi:C-terminal processing protease CtpA/Prc
MHVVYNYIAIVLFKRFADKLLHWCNHNQTFALTFMKLRYLLVLLLLHCFTLGKAQNDSSVFVKTYSPAQLRQDIKYVRDTLTKKHPNLYWYIIKGRLNKKFDSLEKAINTPLTAVQFKFKLQCVLASIGDGHISLLVNGQKISPDDKLFFYGGTAYPIQQLTYRILNGKLYVIQNLSGNDAIALGAEILAIGDQPASKLIGQLCASVCSDGYNQTFKPAAVNVSAYLAQIYCFLNGRQEKLTFTIKQNDSIKTCQLSIITNPIPAEPKPTQTVVNNTTVSGSESPAYIKVSQFVGQIDPFVTFFGTVKRNGVKCLMLDLRDNTGGNLAQMLKLFSYFINKPTYFNIITMGGISNAQRVASAEFDPGSKTPIVPDSNHFDGKVYVMMNGLTFSAAALLAANLQIANRGVFVGEETGGGRNGCMGGVYHEGPLPNTSLLFNFGLDNFKTITQVKQKGRGVMPDVPITYTIDDYLANKDLETEWIKNDISVKGILK